MFVCVCVCVCQVASGLAYLHEHKIVYYDLKSPNILVFQFPSAHDSLLATQGQGFTDQCATPSSKNVGNPGKRRVVIYLLYFVVIIIVVVVAALT